MIAQVFRSKLLLAVCALLGLSAAVLAVKELRHYVIWDNFGVVEQDRVYRSGRLKPAQFAEAMERYQLKTILNLSYEPERDADVQRIASECGVEYVTTTWPGDGVVPPEKLDWALSILADPANQPILVHCARGTQRTGATIARFRVEQGMTREQIRREMEGYRYDVDDNVELEGLIDGLIERKGSESPQTTVAGSS